MDKINKSADEGEKKTEERYPWEFMALMISLVVGVILIGLKIAGVF